MKEMTDSQYLMKINEVYDNVLELRRKAIEERNYLNRHSYKIEVEAMRYKIDAYAAVLSLIKSRFDEVNRLR